MTQGLGVAGVKSQFSKHVTCVVLGSTYGLAREGGSCKMLAKRLGS